MWKKPNLFDCGPADWSLAKLLMIVHIASPGKKSALWEQTSRPIFNVHSKTAAGLRSIKVWFFYTQAFKNTVK